MKLVEVESNHSISWRFSASSAQQKTTMSYGGSCFRSGISRFISPDTIVSNATNPQSYNRYSYVLNNPLLFIDPSGHIACGSELMPEEGSCDEDGNWLSKPPRDADANFVVLGEPSIVLEPVDALTEVYYYMYTIYYEQFCPNGNCFVDPFGNESPELVVYFLAIERVNGDLETTGLSPEGLLDAYKGGEAIATGIAVFILQQFGTPCSFSAETLVTTENGLVPISELEIGDYVLAYNEETGETGYYPVTATWAHEDPVIVYLTIEGETIETTPNHPFYTVEGEWVHAGNLVAGDEIRNSTWGTGTVKTISFLSQPQLMYNLTVDTAHTYFVGDGQWLVHNQCHSISMNDAIEKAVEFTGDTGKMELTGNGSNYQFRSTTTNANGDTVVRVGRLDVNMADNHVSNNGPHLNLQEWVNGVETQNSHIPIDPTTILPGDFP